MKKYLVKESNILHNHKKYTVGSIIELPKEDAERLANYLTEVVEKVPVPEKVKEPVKVEETKIKNNDKSIKVTTEVPGKVVKEVIDLEKPEEPKA